MNLTQLSDLQLMNETRTLVKQESELLLAILHHLKEIDRRRLYSDFKQPGLLELVMNELGYPRDQALRRILAMRMMRDNPVVEEKIRGGELNLTTLGIVQNLFSQEKKSGKPLSAQEKRNVVEKVCGKSTREAQKIVFSLSSRPLMLNEKIKMIAADRYEMTAVIDEETVSVIENLKGLLAHTHPGGISNGELVKMLAQNASKEFARAKSVAAPRPNADDKQGPRSVKDWRPFSKAEVKRQVWRRDSERCTNCGSTFAVQEDHRHPKAKGGEYSLKNIRLLCRSCNQRAAIRHFGAQKMGKYLVRQE